MKASIMNSIGHPWRHGKWAPLYWHTGKKANWGTVSIGEDLLFASSNLQSRKKKKSVLKLKPRWYIWTNTLYFPSICIKEFLPQFKSDSGGETSGNHDAFTEHHKMLTYKAENYVMYHFVLNQMPSHAGVSGDEEWQVPNVLGEKWEQLKEIWILKINEFGKACIILLWSCDV